jgi:hypothetical protein
MRARSDPDSSVENIGATEQSLIATARESRGNVAM